jgi:hypothetical protein
MACLRNRLPRAGRIEIKPMRRNRRRTRVRRSAALLGLCVGGLLAPAAVLAAGSDGHAARTISISDGASLHLTSHHGFTLNEQGEASGTIAGTIYIHLHVVSTNHVSAEVNIYPHGGSITGSASAAYHPSGALASFSGTMSVLRGTGSYAGAHGSGLSFTGSVRRTNDAVSVHVSGRFST